MINAFSNLVLKNRNVYLTLVGEGEDTKKLKEMVKKLELTEKVFFSGYIAGEKRLDFYRKTDVFVHPGIWPEAFGRSILEALSFEVPVIVSDVGAPPEIVGAAGLVFKSGSSKDLAKKIEIVLKNRLILENMRHNCLNVLENYDPSKIIKELLALYKKEVDL